MSENAIPRMDDRRILITGGLGFVGSNLARRCLQLGATVTVYDCLDPRSGGNLHNVVDIDEDIDIIVNDIRNLESVCRAVRRQDILFHCAGYTSHPNSMKDPLMDIEVNCKGTINILEAARRFNPDAKIVCVGTSTQIGRMGRLHMVVPTSMHLPLIAGKENATVRIGHRIVHFGFRMLGVLPSEQHGETTGIVERLGIPPVLLPGGFAKGFDEAMEIVLRESTTESKVSRNAK